MKETLFIDTTAFYAILDKSDKNHNRAKDILLRLHRKAISIYTTNFVLLETSILTHAKLGRQSLLYFRNKILDTKWLQIFHIFPELEQEAWKVLEEYEDKDFSFVDCTSFRSMEILKISIAFTFDRHFQQYGFKTIPASLLKI